MPLYQAFILGAVQGLTEFLPISSSGHLTLVPWLFGWSDPGLTFDVALHAGTLIALLVYFWRDWLHYIQAAFTSLFRRSMAVDGAKTAWLLLAATIPGAVIGALGDNWFEQHVRQPALIASLLIVFAGVLYVIDRAGKKVKSVEQMSWTDGIVVGFSQAIALFPGVSRSGATISAGLLRGLTREAAARFSFLLAMPITAGAVLFKAVDIVQSGGLPSDQRAAFAVGIATAAVVGLAAIKWMLAYVRKQSLDIFIWYRVIAGAIFLIIALIRG